MSKQTFVQYDITDLRYGEKWSSSFEYLDKNNVPIPITGRRLYGEFRLGKDRTGTLIHSVDSFATPSMIVDAALGQFQITITPEDALKFTKAKGVWDLWLLTEDNSDRDCLLYGKWESNEFVTNFETLNLVWP